MTHKKEYQDILLSVSENPFVSPLTQYNEKNYLQFLHFDFGSIGLIFLC